MQNAVIVISRSHETLSNNDFRKEQTSIRKEVKKIL